MKTKPYVTHAERAKVRWTKVGELLGVSPALAQEVFLQCFFRVMDPYDFQDWLETEQDAKEKILSRAKGITLPKPMSAAESALSDEIIEEISRKNYDLKCLIEVGDEILAGSTETFLSGGEYITKGKWYRVLSLEERPSDGLTDFTGTTTTNMPKERNFFGAHSVTVLRRNGKVIWNRE